MLSQVRRSQRPHTSQNPRDGLLDRMGSPIEVAETTVYPGEKGNLQTIEVMKKLARKSSGHPRVKLQAIEILNQYLVEPNNYLDESFAIGDWVKNHIRYVKDADFIEQLTHPLTMLDLIYQGRARGDCDDMSLLIATLLLSIGHTPLFRAVRYKHENGPYNHIYVVDYERNFGEKKHQRVVLDAILRGQPIGVEVPHKNGKEFPI